MFKPSIHRNIYLFFLAILGISLPISLFLMSVAQLALSLNWVLEFQYKEKFKNLISRQSILLFCSIILLYLLGFLYSKDNLQALNEFKMKLPLLALPIIVGTSSPLTKKELHYILMLFCGTVLVTSIISTVVWLGLTTVEVKEIRDISLYISHIRFALLIDITLLILTYYLYTDYFSSPVLIKIFYLISIIWLILFLLILQAYTGIIILIIVLIAGALYFIYISKKRRFKVIGLILVFLFLSSIIGLLRTSLIKFYSIQPTDENTLPAFTVNGNLYYHNLKNKTIENGNFVYINICWKELEKEWNKRSTIHFDSTNHLGQPVKQTIIRYLASKNLNKDSLGISELSDKDILNIENGMSNYIFQKRLSIYSRLYRTIWEVYIYQTIGIADGHSLTQRIEYQKTALYIWKNNLLFGVGPGDYKEAFKKAYTESNTVLSKPFQVPYAHNQFLTFAINFGIFGLLWICFAFFYPLFYERKQTDFLSLLFFIILMVSMLTEDTLETHAGISLFTFFYAVFIFGNSNITSKIEKK